MGRCADLTTAAHEPLLGVHKARQPAPTEADDEADDWPVQRCIVPTGAAADTPATRAPASIFDVERLTSRVTRCRLAGADCATRPTVRIERDAGTVRCVRVNPQDTPEWRAHEEARRAKQRPPKPTKKARTRSKKLRALATLWDD